MSTSRDAARRRPPFLERLSEEERAGLEAISRERSFAGEEIVMFQGAVDDRLLVLLTGRVKVTRANEDGREILLAIRGGGDLIGELAFIERLPRIATVTALEPVEALVVSGERFRDYLERTPHVAVVLTEAVAARLRESNARWLQFAALDTLGRLAARIVELADRYGQEEDDGILVPMPISRDDLASWAGASRAGVAQALHTMRELGWIETERRRLLVRDVAALRDRSS